ncbi:ATP-dependent RecD-like DNA helicase [uncultured Phascolarctobacterium sp.]|uniref:SF1B family DNA helicase RecD2 n=1 Tax=uncultured Phascolarctobacterium sp. TaxID=512296 RepID=UPI0025DAB98C|nr:ATP-dependent RecD-like DNA helicase [uncultured Phascolarctobacterium sp.]
MEQLEGVVDDIVFQSEDNMYSVLRVVNKAQGRFTAVYRGPAPYMGENVSLNGSWVEHARFGRQFEAASLTVVQPTSAAGIERFLASGALPGVGAVMASRIVEMFGTDTLEILGQYPEQLARVKGISAKKAALIGEAYCELSGLRDLMLFLETHGVSSGYAAKLQAAYGNTAMTRLQENPYSLADDVAGIGFKTADRIAMAMGMAHDCGERLTAGISYALTAAAGAGHTCVPEELLVRETARALAVDSEAVQRIFNELLQKDRLRLEEVGGTRFIYPEYLYRAEVQTARRLLFLRDQGKPITRVNADEVIAAWEREAGIKLAEAQRQAIYTSLEHGVFVLTGGPGTGKTTVVKGILNVLEKAGCRILLAAPTGRAARRLADSAGHPALTVHRLLEYQPTGDGLCFGKDDEDPLDAEAIIIDEASMLDINLTYHLLKAVPGGCRLIFVGDVDQLPSVGAGSVLKDMIRSGRMPVVRLENVFRQAEVSPIVRNAHKINHGQMPEFTGGDGSEFGLKEFADEQAAASFVAQTYAQMTLDGDWRRVQVLSPMHKSPCGVQNLNKLLQHYINPPSERKPEVSIPGNVLRLGDKVMQIRNNYEKEVFNGDIGRIVKIEGKSVTVGFPERPEGDYVTYSQGECEELQLAYAMSVHKSQGSEYPCVILLMVPSHYIMLQRNLLYTAVTRAKAQVLIVGSKRAVLTAVENDKTRRRHSLLAERLQENQEVFG